MTSPDAPEHKPGRWPVWKIASVAYPAVAGAAAVNIFFFGLMVQRLGVTAFTPQISILVGCVLGLPLAWITGRWFRTKIDEAEADG
ncbi:MAG: hypothetical protein GY952_18490 [Rhodobacteraceae bacterium]|nr:hypothetical protein [Paracoccaceae bacterium]